MHFAVSMHISLLVKNVQIRGFYSKSIEIFITDEK